MVFSMSTAWIQSALILCRRASYYSTSVLLGDKMRPWSTTLRMMETVICSWDFVCAETERYLGIFFFQLNSNHSLQEMHNRTLINILGGGTSIYYLYIVFGSIAVLTNATVIFVHISSIILRRRYRTITFLAMADLINGLAFLING